MSHPPESGTPLGLPPAPPGYMYVPAAPVNRFGLGTALARGFGVFFSNLPSLVVLALVCFLPLLVYLAVMGNPVEQAADLADLERKALLFTIAVVLGSLLTQQILTAAVTYSVVESSAGRRAPIGRALLVGLRRAPPALGIAVLALVCVSLAMLPGILLAVVVPFLGVILAVVGALVAYCALFVAVPASVIERNGFGALGRSVALTRGFRWQILVVFLVSALIAGVINVIPDVAVLGQANATYVAPDDWSLYLGMTVGAQAIGSALSAVFAAVVYVGLRNTRDGVPVDDLAKVFE